MSTEQISNWQGITLVTFFLMGSSLVLQTATEAEKDIWIAIIVGLALATPLIFAYSRLAAHFPGKDLFQIGDALFGTWGGKVVSLIYIWFALHLGALVLRNFGEYLRVVSLFNTPIMVILLSLAILCVWGVKEGVEVLGRLTNLGFIFIVPLILITCVVLIKEWNLEHIQPIFYNGYAPMLRGAFSVIHFPFLEVIIFLLAFPLSGENSSYKIYWGGLLIGGALIWITTLNELLTLGYGIYSQSYFPSYVTVRRLDIANILQRMEIIPSVVLLAGGFIKVSVCLMGVSRGVAHLFNEEDYRPYVTPLGLLMVNLAYLIYDSIINMTNWASQIWPYYAIPFQVVFPIILLVVAEWKVRRSGGDVPAEEE